MVSPPWSARGYSLVELMLVLFIVGVLTIVGLHYISGRQPGGVRSILDELEGALMNAQKATIVTSRDVYISTAGDWLDASMIMDARPFKSTVASPPLAGDLTPGDDTKRQGPSSECFRSHYLGNRDHNAAGVATSAHEAWYATARGAAPDLAGVVPISAQPDFVAALGNRLFTGGANNVVVNGLTKRFETGFSVVVVGLAGGNPMPNGPVGIIVVPANGSSVYKFYKAEGESTWRRL